MTPQARRPREVHGAVYVPGRKVTQVLVEMKNVPGALAKVAGLFGELGINIISALILKAEPSKESGFWAFFLDLTDVDMEAEELAGRLEDLDVVLSVKITERKFGEMLVDATAFPISFLGRRVVVLDLDGISAMLKWLDETFGTGGHAILFDMGYEGGRAVVRKLKEKYGLIGQEALEAFLSFCVAMGWFDYEIVEVDTDVPKLRMRIHDSFECNAFRGRARQPTSHLVRGTISGAASEAFGEEMLAREVKCIALGDGYCELVVEPSGKR